jgi:hypothetical protein
MTHLNDEYSSMEGTICEAVGCTSKAHSGIHKRNQCNNQVNNSVCEAVDCFSPAEVQIKVKVGQAGSISLSLCNNCVRKFSEDDNETHCKVQSSEEVKVLAT